VRGRADGILAADASLAAAAEAATGTVNPAAPRHRAEPPSQGGAAAPPVAWAAPVLLALPRSPGGGGAAGGDDVASPGPSEPPKYGAMLPGGPGESAADTRAIALPPPKGLLVEGVTVGAAAAERAVQALAEPILAAGDGPADLLYWAGLSSWVAAAALACEGARRYWQRRAAQPAPALASSDLLPEADL
jgi:hypothetical protein